jgi:hypothetical protein
MAFNFKKWRIRKPISPMSVVPGDTVEVTSHRTLHVGPINIPLKSRRLVWDEIKKPMRINEVGLFDAEVDGRKAIGGVLIEEEAS